MKVVLRDLNKTVDVGNSNLLAAGGEGSVYVAGGRAIKIYEDPNAMIPEGKIRELSMIATPDILAPLDVVLHKDKVVGFSMDYVPGSLPLPKIYPRSWRQANGLDINAAMHLALCLRNNVELIHGHGFLVVDMNDMNFLARQDLGSVLHIDVNSYRTPSYPATAIMLSFRDPTTQEFTTETDWFSYALVAFSILVGIHPFKGHHPNYAPSKLLDRIADGASVLSPGVQLPKTCMSVDEIPPAWRRWFEGVFHRKDRSLPPETAEGAVSLVLVATVPIGGAVDLSRLFLTANRSTIYLVRAAGGLCAALSDGTILLDGKACPTIRKGAPAALGVTARSRRPVAMWWASGKAGGELEVYDISTGNSVGTVPADEVSSRNGSVHFRYGENLMELRFLESNSNGLVLSPARIGSISQYATSLYPGVAIQLMLGATYASILFCPGICVQVRLKEIEGSRVLDARFVGGTGPDGQSGVLQVVVDRAGRTDLHEWSGLHMAGSFKRHSVTNDVSAPDLNLVELDTGVCVSVTPTGEIRLFRPGSGAEKTIPDKTFHGHRLFSDAGDLLADLGDGLYRAKLKARN